MASAALSSIRTAPAPSSPAPSPATPSSAAPASCRHVPQRRQRPGIRYLHLRHQQRHQFDDHPCTTIPSPPGPPGRPGFSSTIAITGVGPFVNFCVPAYPQGYRPRSMARRSRYQAPLSTQGTSPPGISASRICSAIRVGCRTSRYHQSPLSDSSLAATQWTVNRAGFSGTISVSGGTTPYTLSAQIGLPPGLTASSPATPSTLPARRRRREPSIAVASPSRMPPVLRSRQPSASPSTRR